MSFGAIIGPKQREQRHDGLQKQWFDQTYINYLPLNNFQYHFLINNHKVKVNLRKPYTGCCHIFVAWSINTETKTWF